MCNKYSICILNCILPPEKHLWVTSFHQVKNLLDCNLSLSNIHLVTTQLAIVKSDSQDINIIDR